MHLLVFRSELLSSRFVVLWVPQKHYFPAASDDLQNRFLIVVLSRLI